MEVIRKLADNGNTHIHFGDEVVGRFMHDIPAVPAGTEGTEPVNWSDSAYDDLWQGMDELAAIRRDARLSAVGKAERETMPTVKLIENPAKLRAALDGYEQSHVISAEAFLLKGPDIAPTNMYMSTRASEIRTYVSVKIEKGRINDVLAAIAGGRASDEFIAALLDDPIGLMAEHTKVIRDVWEDRRRREKPDEFAVIDQRKKAIERARRVNACISAATSTVVGWEPTRILETLVKSSNEFAQRGLATYGFNASQAAHMRLSIASRRTA